MQRATTPFSTVKLADSGLEHAKDRHRFSALAQATTPVQELAPFLPLITSLDQRAARADARRGGTRLVMILSAISNLSLVSALLTKNWPLSPHHTVPRMGLGLYWPKVP